MAFLAAHNVTKTFREGKTDVAVLRGVSVNIQRGEVVALEGPSGSGKTTLLSILGCILTPTSGSIVVNGRELVAADARVLPEVRRSSIGFVFQQYNLFPALTAAENVEYALNIKGIRGRDAERQAVELLDRVGLADKMHSLPRDLSGGQKQRVAIARALGGSPSVLLADEPTANLDSETGIQILELFQRMARLENAALLVVTHDPKVRAISDRVLSISDGRIN